MALDSILRKGVAIAAKLTRPLQVPIVHEQWRGIETTGTVSSGRPLYDTPRIRMVLLDQNSALKRSTGGENAPMDRTTLLFLHPIPNILVPGRKGPIDPRDRITLADGRTLPILSVGPGFSDPTTHSVYAYTVTLGG